MAANAGGGFRPPKCWTLTENETITSYANWQSNIEYHMSLNNEFTMFLTAEWQKKSVTNRGLTADPANQDGTPGKTAVQKNLVLERMLGLVAQFAPSLLRNDIIKKSTSLAWIWSRIRKHYSFSKSEVHFLKLHAIRHKENERYETLFQRIISHLEDNLLTTGGTIQYDGAAVTTDEELTPTCERLAV